MSMKAENIAVRYVENSDTKELTHIRMTGVNGDKEFAREVFHKQGEFEKGGTSGRLNPLLLFPQVEMKIDPIIRRSLTRRGAPEEIVCAWLFSMSRENDRYTMLEALGEVTREDLEQMKLPLQLSTAMVDRVYGNAKIVRDTMLQNRGCTHTTLLEAIYPTVNKTHERRRKELAASALNVEDSPCLSIQSMYLASLDKDTHDDETERLNKALSASKGMHKAKQSKQQSVYRDEGKVPSQCSYICYATCIKYYWYTNDIHTITIS